MPHFERDQTWFSPRYCRHTWLHRFSVQRSFLMMSPRVRKRDSGRCPPDPFYASLSHCYFRGTTMLVPLSIDPSPSPTHRYVSRSCTSPIPKRDHQLPPHLLFEGITQHFTSEPEALAPAFSAIRPLTASFCPVYCSLMPPLFPPRHSSSASPRCLFVCRGKLSPGWSSRFLSLVQSPIAGVFSPVGRVGLWSLATVPVRLRFRSVWIFRTDDSFFLVTWWSSY